MNKNGFITTVICILIAASNLSGGNLKTINNSNDEKQESDKGIKGGFELSKPAYNPPRSSLNIIKSAFYLKIIPSSSAIVNKDVYNDEYWDANKGFSLNIEVGYLKKINNIVGFGFGIGSSSYSTEIVSPDMKHKITVQECGEDIIYYPDIKDLSEKILINYFDIPFFLVFSNTNIDKIGFYGRLGLKLSFPYASSASSSGSVYYDKYFTHGQCTVNGAERSIYSTYVGRQSIHKVADIDIRPINLSAMFSFGITFPLSNIWVLRLGVNNSLGLLEISKNKQDNYEPYSYDGDFYKLVENPNSKTYTRSFGFEIGVSYNLKLF